VPMNAVSKPRLSVSIHLNLEALMTHVGEVIDPSHEEPEPAHLCPVCGGESMKMGSLGKRSHYRCRACGHEFNHKESK
jgi:tRNA(Ile2) C34 agmatinyltransferase TiaS